MLLYKLYNSEKYKRYRRIDNIRKHKEDESILKYEKFKYNIKLYSRDCKYVKPSIFNTQRRYCKKYSVVTACKPFECLYIINKVKSVVS